MKEEIFGAILPVIEYDSFDYVIKFINDRPKPLTLYYYGSNNEHKKRIENETSSGSIAYNESIFHLISTEIPFGGI